MKIGDKVEIKDGSYAVRVDEYEPYPSIGLCTDIFEVIGYGEEFLLSKGYEEPVHDIYIKNTVDGKIYLHSKSMVHILPDKLHYGMKVMDDEGDEYMVSQIDCDTNILIAMTGFDVGNRWNEENVQTTDDLPEGWRLI